MKFFIMGGAGFIGGPLIRHIIMAGHEVTALTRNISRVEYRSPQATLLVGDPLKPGKWQEMAAKADVIINLVGKPIMVRWTHFPSLEAALDNLLSK